MTPTPRRSRVNGEASKVKILDAATEVASERGYDGTSIAQVSKRCGLPASSIYWHFADKDDLIAAVIERSFGQWLSAWSVPDGDDARLRLRQMAGLVAQSLLDSPDFLRLGLMLALERRPVEPRARAMYVRVRDEAHQKVREAAGEFVPGLDDAGLDQLATYAMAGADGLFVAKEIGGDDVDLPALFELHASAVMAVAARLGEIRIGEVDQ